MRTRQQWQPPIHGLKFNIDGSFDHKTGAGGAGGILRDNRGNWVKRFMAKISVKSPLEAKTRALYIGLHLAIQLKCSNICIATGSVMLANECNNGVEPNSNLMKLCRGLLRRLGDPQVIHKGRMTNKAADRLVEEGKG